MNMGMCMKDHPKEDLKEKMEDVQELLAEDVAQGIHQNLDNNSWDQSDLNELFHALKRLEKKITEEEKDQTVEKIKSFLSL